MIGIKNRIIDIAYLKRKRSGPDQDFNYEQILIDLLNRSKMVEEKGGFFHHNDIQNNKECDASNGIYDIDFKLLVNENTMKTKDKMEISTSELSKGVTAYHEGEGSEPIYVISYLQFLSKMKNVNKDDKFYSLINNLIKLINIDKNILLFIPEDIYIHENCSDQKTINTIFNSIIDVFINIKKYKYTKKDLYVCFISGDKMVFVNYVDEKPKVYDIVPLKESKSYLYIKNNKYGLK